MKTNTVVVMLVAALALGLVGGIVGGVLLPQSGDVAGRVDGLEQRVNDLAARPGLRVAFVDAEGLFQEVFLPQVARERRVMEEKQAELAALQQRYVREEISQTAYQEGALRIQVEALRAQVQVNLTMLEKMLASDGFATLRAQLREVREQARPIEAEVERLLEESRAGILDPEGFMSQTQAVQMAIQRLDQLLTQVAASKIVEISQQVGREEGYDLVLRKKEVIVYWDGGVIKDLTSTVEPRLWRLFP